MVGNPGNLRIETNLYVHPPAEDGGDSVSASLLSPAARGRSLSFTSSTTPTLRISSDMPRSPVAESLSNMAMSQGIGKARNESRKLLAHILGQLKRRPMPPTLFRALGNRTSQPEKGLETVVRTVKVIAAMKSKRSRSSNTAPEPEDSDDDFIDDREFHTDATYDLLSQVRDVLMISVAQKWDIFSDSGGFLEAPTKSNSRRSSEDRTSFLRRRSMQGSRSRSRSASPSRKTYVKAPELLSECISILSSIVLEDCRYQISAPKPSRPSFSLQNLTLDISQFLLHVHRNNPRTVSQIALAIIPAFHTFPRVMHSRLLQFFEEGVLGEMLDQLGRLQGRQSASSHSPDETLNADSQAPMVSIQVDEVQDPRAPSSVQNWRRWTSPDEGIHASTMPEQDSSIYYLTSVISPLLAAILENVNLLEDKIPTVHRFHHLIDRLICGKPEVYLDLLNVIAYHTPRVRHRATSLLLSYWPKAIGHIVLTKPFPDVSYAAALAREAIRDRRQSSAKLPTALELSHAHQFVPWRFSASGLPQIFEGFSQNECRVCSEPMDGFGLSCPFCMCSVHFDCYDYPEGSFFTQYSLDSEPDIQKVAVHRFCHVLPFRRDGADPYVRHGQHFFRLVNMFTLALCFVCQKPLWGCVMQGLKCNTCKHFVHASCIRDAVPHCREEYVISSHITVKWSVLRQTFVEHYRDLAFTETEARSKSYEEICIAFAVLWTQLEILENGMALGSVVIIDDSSGRKTQDFELHYLVALYSALLQSGNLPISGTLLEYLTENGYRPQDHLFYFDWNTLAYVISAVKLPHSDLDASHAPDLLGVGLPSSQSLDELEDSAHPFEVVSLAHVRNQFGDILQLITESAARHLLSHVHHIGILQRLDHEQDLWSNTPSPERLQVCFPIPFGFDVSADIETLVAVIEACLSDLDLSINEAGLLLLIRRFWPNGMLTPYSFQRLSKAILTWIFAEDDNLLIIMREYVGRQRSLPGVRSGIEAQPWPAPVNNRGTGGSSNSGGDYVASRRALLQRYAAPWMLAFHDRDINAYANTLYELLVEHAEGTYTDGYFLRSLSETETQKRNAGISDRILRHIIKICQASVVFTVFDDLFHRWLEQAHILNTLDEPNTSLTRLFNGGSDAVNRFSSAADLRGTVQDVSQIPNTNPLFELLAAAQASRDGFVHGLHWLCLFVSSTVDVPISAFTQMAQLAERFQADLDECALLIKATLWSSYQRSMGRQELQEIVATIHVHLTAQILDGLRSRTRVTEIAAFIRQSLATCLLLYGCDRDGLKGNGIIMEEEIKVLISRRKLPNRASELMDPIIVDSRLMAVLKSYVEMRVDEVSCLAARFLNLLVNESPLLESYEVDNFILRNGPNLCQCMWSFYGIELSDVSVTRAALLLRILVVDTQPFQSLLAEQFEGQDDWQMRMQSLSWLFRMVLDTTSPAFVLLDDRQWRPNIIDIFYYFFSALWLDDREEIRLTVETWSETLLPPHYEAISLCWDEALNKAPIAERSRLVHFLLQLRPHFPSWRVLRWETITETLLEHDFIQQNGNNGDADLSAYGVQSNDEEDGKDKPDPELLLLQVSLLSLSLRMIADGITIDIASILKIKGHLLRLIGSPDTRLESSGAGPSFYVDYEEPRRIVRASFPCLDDLLLVLDASHPFELAPSAMRGPLSYDETRTKLLVGSAFTDVVLSIFIYAEDLLNLPPLTLKNLFKALLAVIYKHDIESKPLRSLQGNLRLAVKRCLDLVMEDKHLSYELRQLALSTCQAFIKRWPASTGNFVCEAIETTTAAMISLNYEQSPEDMLVSQARQFVDTTLGLYSMGGVLNVLLKRKRTREFFLILRYVMETKRKGVTSTPVHANLREALLRDTLVRAVDNEVDSYQIVIDNIGTFVELVYHQNFTNETMQFVGSFLTGVARRIADWPSNAFKPNSILIMVSTVIENNKAQCRELLGPLETFIRVVLSRFDVSVNSIDKTLQVTTSLYHKSVQPAEMLGKNQIALAFVELLYEGLAGKARIPPVTLASLMEALIPGQEKVSHLVLPENTITRLTDVGLSYLNPENAESPMGKEFVASQAVARMILNVAQEQVKSKQEKDKVKQDRQDRQDRQDKHDRHDKPDKPEKPVLFLKIGYPDNYASNPKPRNASMAVRAWNLVVLSAALYPSNGPAQMLMEYLPNFAAYYSRCLRPYSQMDTAPQELLHVDMNRAYASIRLWLVLCRKAATKDDQSDGTPDKETHSSRVVWNELWPPFETVVQSLPMDTQTGSQAALAATVASCVADLFLFLRQMQSIVTIEVASQITLLNKLRQIKRAEAKINKALRGLSEAPTQTPLDTIITQIQAEIQAEEKLEAAKRQEPPRMAPERMRRIAS